MVAVLMSTYNGAAYLKEQINSILNQTYQDFVLYIRDDGSTDNTCALIREYTDRRIRFITGGNLGPAGSFFALLQQEMDADYVFFSDQDDIWYPEKMERMLRAIEDYGDTPTMVFSDFSMIDSNGCQTAPSYARYASLQVTPGNVSLGKVIAQPYVFGCASVINRALSQLVAYPPEGIEMHDCWICQSAAAVGNLIYIPEQTIAHRFHNCNATGRSGQDSAAARLKRMTRGFQDQVRNTALRLHQVDLLLEHQREHLLPEALAALTEISASMKNGKLNTLKALKKYGVSRQKKSNTLFFYLTVLGIKGEIT